MIPVTYMGQHIRWFYLPENKHLLQQWADGRTVEEVRIHDGTALWEVVEWFLLY